MYKIKFAWQRHKVYKNKFRMFDAKKEKIAKNSQQLEIIYEYLCATHEINQTIDETFEWRIKAHFNIKKKAIIDI